MNAACWRCTYFDQKMDEEQDGGFCRRYPPRAVSEDVVVWVGVDFMDWCGEFMDESKKDADEMVSSSYEGLQAITGGFSDWLRAELRRHGMSQKDLAERCGITQAAVSRYVAGYRAPRFDTVVRILGVLMEER